jgi:hypothetical protein
MVPDLYDDDATDLASTKLLAEQEAVAKDS